MRQRLKMGNLSSLGEDRIPDTDKIGCFATVLLMPL